LPKKFIFKYHNFNSIWVQHASIHVKRYGTGTQVKKVTVKLPIFRTRSGFINPIKKPESNGSHHNTHGNMCDEKKRGKTGNMARQISSVDPYVFGPPGFASGSFYHQEKIVRKTLIPTFCTMM
jgi:hypothetical protein